MERAAARHRFALSDHVHAKDTYSHVCCVQSKKKTADGRDKEGNNGWDWAKVHPVGIGHYGGIKIALCQSVLD